MAACFLFRSTADDRPAVPTSTAVEARELRRVDLGMGDDLAVGIALTHNLAEDVEDYVRSSQLPVCELLTLGPADGPARAPCRTRRSPLAGPTPPGPALSPPSGSCACRRCTCSSPPRKPRR
jgi:hypothetical protein